MIKIDQKIKRFFTISFALACGALALVWPEWRTELKAQGYYEVINVPEDYPNIQAGIDAAVDGDTVVVADGTYTGAGNKDIDFCGKAITVKSENGAEFCIIDCEGDGRGFNFHSFEDKNSILEGFTITSGYEIWGGGISCYESSPFVINCTFSNNYANVIGGGIGCYHFSSPIIVNCIFSNNFSDSGGGIFCEDSSSPNILNCTVSDNYANSGDGGGISCDDTSSPNIINSIIWNNIPNQITSNSEIVVIYSNIQDGWNGEGNINADPMFIGSGDYHLTFGSPCIDTGLNDIEDLPDMDIDGDSRIINTYVDMGVDEYSYVSKDPVVDIKVNGSDEPLKINSGTLVTVSISFDAGSYENQKADLWVGAKKNQTIMTYTDTGGWQQGITPYTSDPLSNFNSITILNKKLPAGIYRFVIGLDKDNDGAPNFTWVDSVIIKIQ